MPEAWTVLVVSATEDGASDTVSGRHGLVVEGDSAACIANRTKAKQGVINSLDDVASMGESSGRSGI